MQNQAPKNDKVQLGDRRYRRGRAVLSGTSQIVQALGRMGNKEENVLRDASKTGISGSYFLFGLDVNRPTESYMKDRGVGSVLYFSTDTFALSAWTGIAWKSTTLS